jgi:hypothetical protein
LFFRSSAERSQTLRAKAECALEAWPFLVAENFVLGLNGTTPGISEFVCCTCEYTHPAVGSSQVLYRTGELGSANLIGVSLAYNKIHFKYISIIKFISSTFQVHFKYVKT